MIYSKKYPSKKYLQNINYYKEMHQNGFQRLDKFIDKENAYDGMSTKPFVNIHMIHTAWYTAIIEKKR